MRFGLRELLFVAVLLSMPLAAWWFVFKPNNLQIAEARKEIRAKRAKLEELKAATSHIQDLDREIANLREAIELFEEKLPAEKEVEVILREVWQLAVRHGLKPKTVRAEKPIESSRYSELPLNMTIAGGFDGYYSFLLDVERLKRITRIPQMKLVKMTKGEEGSMEAEFTLTIFFEPNGKSTSVAER